MLIIEFAQHRLWQAPTRAYAPPFAMAADIVIDPVHSLLLEDAPYRPAFLSSGTSAAQSRAHLPFALGRGVSHGYWPYPAKDNSGLAAYAGSDLDASW
jgi:hypothetical protein